MNQTEQVNVIQQDLSFIKVKEIQEIIRKTNDLVKSQQRVSGSGRKQEIIGRYTNFLMALLLNKKHTILNSVVNIVNREVNGRFNWGYNNEEIISSTSRTLRPGLWERQNESTLNLIKFQMEPFFKTVGTISGPQIIPARGSRNTVDFRFQITPEHISLLQMPSDGTPQYEIRFCCALYSTHNQALENGLPLEFPNTCELKINQTIIPNTSLRCIKGKPGTIHPANLSTGVNITGANVAELLYMQTHQPYVAAIYIVKRKSIASFIEEMKGSGALTKEKHRLFPVKTISEDADIVMESETLSLKCPLAFTRINTPCRSIHCNHLQCFDASTFLIMNEQTPTWSCPVCYKNIAHAKDLAVDEYFSEILKTTPADVESVKVEPDGTVVLDKKEEINSLDDTDDEDNGTTTTNNVKAENIDDSTHRLHNGTHDGLQNGNAIIILDDDEDDVTDDGKKSNQQTDSSTTADSTLTSSTTSDATTSDAAQDQQETQNSLDDPLQIQLQNQIHLRLQQPSMYADNQQQNRQTTANNQGYPNKSLPPIFPKIDKLPISSKRASTPPVGPPAKRTDYNVIDLTFSSDDES